MTNKPMRLNTTTPLSSLKAPRVDTAPVVTPPYQRRDSDRYCGLCAAWFNNPLMAQQHYDGKKHKKNAARVALLEQLGTSLDLGELRATTCLLPLGRGCWEASERSPNKNKPKTPGPQFCMPYFQEVPD
ncbi:Zmat4 [Phodopus roborovskii]|uniref:Zmat4 protein n=1 Tax=Phodopus roborovskii TaxID=109678 RepID=A0AAU9Z4Z9_PHORO|nr:Zmat4 [Phodopus roborovskii]